MPSSYTLDTLPKSADPRVTIRAIPEQRFATIRFSKFSTEANVAEQTSLLVKWMDKKGLVASGAPQFARYDPPIRAAAASTQRNFDTGPISQPGELKG